MTGVKKKRGRVEPQRGRPLGKDRSGTGGGGGEALQGAKGARVRVSASGYECRVLF